MSDKDLFEESGIIPTLAIGVGMGGVSVVKEFISFVEKNGIIDNYRFVAIDSNIDDLNRIIEFAPNTSKIAITDHQYDVMNLKKNCPYLHKWVVMQKGGALQERVYGRFLLDLHKEEITRTITAHIHDLSNLWKEKEGGGEKRGHIAIWIIHSLGGGTGSGSFPALAIYLQKIVKEILGNKGITPHIYGVGILPSGTNITDISTATFTKRYFANSFAALEEVKVLAAASDVAPVTLKLPFHGEPIQVTERPFERYFLFGIDEELTTKLRKEKGEMVDDYLSHANKIIVTMMFALPQYPKGLENLWKDVPSPFASFGESELNIPIRLVKYLAGENDLLGPVIDENESVKAELRKLVIDAMKEFLRNLNESFLEDRALAVFQEYRLLGLAYFVGKLQNQINKLQINIQSEYEEELDTWWETLRSESWSCDQIERAGVVGLEEKHNLIVELFNSRIEELVRKLDSLLVSPLKKPDLRERKEKIEKILHDLEVLKVKTLKVRTLKQYVDTKIGEKLSLQNRDSKEKILGVASIVTFARKKDAYRQNVLKKRLGLSGSGRVLNPALSEDIMNSVSLVRDINVAHMKSLADYFQTLKFSQKDVDKIIKNRIEQSRDRHLSVAIGSGGEILTNPREELFILCNMLHESALGDNIAFASMKVVKIPSQTYNDEKVEFIDYTLNLSIEDVKEYNIRKAEYVQNKLKEKTDIAGPIGTIFAYPEWFPKDPLVQEVYLDIGSES
ncbi:hypothetical protein Mhun_0728 [Methanospirillum hungatei JF-1]|jgi:hypothetical protein|uniref:Tubulin-like protein n=1 Tax=Methanospirillum hungatei JF-1 (strain ATCC 27890 / DSM 864 / NBRC 100397 / JF-1) TaxID=323259 RepID=Q2FPY8_METHJ|nr:tubulin-like doman-containing protein [Methanospirillum hungatei]ABD40481.1 hypothetical protein Mhun_0728 [Methanospirillum hungatei JF-1]